MKKTACILCISAVIAILGCSDGNSEYPAEKESAGKTNDGNDLVVFNRGDLDEILFKIDTVYITDTSFLGRLFFRNLPPGKTPEPGDIINSTITKNAPYGFLYRVTEVSREGEDITIVSVAYASLAEAVEEADIEFEIPLVYGEEDGLDGQILAKKCSNIWNCAVSLGKDVVNTGASLVSTGVNAAVEFAETVVDAFAGNWDVGGTKKKTFEVNEWKSFGNSKDGGNVQLDGSYTLSLTARIKLKNYSLDYAKMSIAQNKYLKLDGNLYGSLSYKKDFDLASYGLPNIEFMVGPVLVVLKNTAVIKVKVEAQAQANMSANLVFSEFSEYGFEYSGGSFKRLNTCSKNFGYGYKHSVYGSVRLGVLVGFNSLCYGIAGFEFSVGPSLELKSPSLPLTADSKTTLNSDLDIDVSAKLQILDYFKKEHNFGSARISLGALANSKTLPSFDFKPSDFDLKGIAGGKLSFPFKISKPSLGFSVEEYGFCIEAKEGECIKGPGYGLGKLGKVAGNTISFEGLESGIYNIIPYFKSIDGEIHYDMANALKNFVIGTYCGTAAFDPKAKFCIGNVLYDLCGGKEYNPAAQFCNSDVVYDLCVGNLYNPYTHFCYGSSLYALCGGSSYNPSTHFCFDKSAYYKCGGSSYDPSEQGCCNARLFNLNTYRCSGNEIVDKVDGHVIDSQGNKYGYVEIGTQTWMADNLNYNVPGSRCYDDDPVNCRIYGRLYDWATAMALPDSCNAPPTRIRDCRSQIKDPHQGICLEGYHIPTDGEWSTLFRYVDNSDCASDSDICSTVRGTKLKSSSGWNFYDDVLLGTDNYGFAALPGGYGNQDGSFYSVGDYGLWWSVNEGNTGSYLATVMELYYDFMPAVLIPNSKSTLHSIRCVKD